MATRHDSLDYSPDLFAQVCASIAEGNSLAKTCSKPDMPSTSVIYKWFHKHPETVAIYAQAKEDSGDADQDKLDQIAEMVLDGDLDPNQARVAADIYKWTASKKKPKKYGDLHRYMGEVDTIKIEHNITVNTTSLLGNIGQVIDVTPETKALDNPE